MHQLVTQGVQRSESFRVLVQTVGFHPSVELELRFRKQVPRTHAQSFLQVRVAYAEVNGRVIRQVSRVSGEITVRSLAYGRDQIGDLAHELAHIIQLLEGVPPEDLDSSMCWAEAYRSKVVAELEAYGRSARDLEHQP